MNDNKLYRKTPIMGWASWNCFRTDISEEKMKLQADALVRTGLIDCGYEYFNMDDGFFGGRDEKGNLLFHPNRFPHGIKIIADYAHSLGLKSGIYSDAGSNTCAYYWDNEGANGEGVGLYGHEHQDLKLFLEEYGFDFIKVDWCGGQKLDLNEKTQYTKIARIIDEIRHKTGQCKVFNICRWQFPGEWAVKIADSWRTGADITADFNSVVYQLDNIKSLSRFAGPGHVNDLDMMQLGNGMNYDEERSHFSLWCMMSSPLIIGCDLTKISDSTLSILKNKELIAINQDTACLQAYVAKEVFDSQGFLTGEVWIKNLGCDNSNEKAVAFFNRSTSPVRFKINLSDIGLSGNVISSRDLWKHQDISTNGHIDIKVGPHCTEVYHVKTEKSIHIDDKYALCDSIVSDIKKLPYDKLEHMMQNGAKLIDVRSEEEFNEFHLELAENIPYTESHTRLCRCNPDKNQNIVVYCRTGKRSAQARDVLTYLGYKNVYILTNQDKFFEK